MLVDIATIPEVTKNWLHMVEMGETVAFVKNGHVIATLNPNKETSAKPSIQPQKRQAGALAHLFKESEDIGRVFLEPMSEEDLAWWNGDNTDDYGISLTKENGNVK